MIPRMTSAELSARDLMQGIDALLTALALLLSGSDGG